MPLDAGAAAARRRRRSRRRPATTATATSCRTTSSTPTGSPATTARPTACTRSPRRPRSRLLVVPDLYWPAPLPPSSTASSTRRRSPGREFEPCVEPADGTAQAQAPPELDGLLLDPRDPAELARDRRLPAAAGRARRAARPFVVLLDVPPGLDQRRILAWRGALRLGLRGRLPPLARRRAPRRRAATRRSRVNPSAFAAGIIAAPRAAARRPVRPGQRDRGAASSTSPTPCRRRATTSCTRRDQRVPARARRHPADRGAHALRAIPPTASSASAG